VIFSLCVCVCVCASVYKSKAKQQNRIAQVCAHFYSSFHVSFSFFFYLSHSVLTKQGPNFIDWIYLYLSFFFSFSHILTYVVRFPIFNIHAHSVLILYTYMNISRARIYSEQSRKNISTDDQHLLTLILLPFCLSVFFFFFFLLLLPLSNE